MILSVTIDKFMQISGLVPLADVRTPAEFLQGHVPGAFNLPLFSNEERARVGTTYKQVSREEAILLGFDLQAVSGLGLSVKHWKWPRKKELPCTAGVVGCGAAQWRGRSAFTVLKYIK